MRGPTAHAVALLALSAAAVTLIDPSEAFTSGSLERDVRVEVVSDAAAYHAITGGTTCTVSATLGGTCSITVANQGASSGAFYATEEPEGSEVTQYKIGSSAYVASGRTGSSGSIDPGSSTTLAADIAPCALCTTREATFTVEGEKSDTLSSMLTRIKLTIQYA